jgi:type I restriction enzyme S subunit
MKYRYRTDDEMKDSGVEWLGKIPKEWRNLRLKYLFEYEKGKNPKKLLEENKENTYPYLSTEYLRTGNCNSFSEKENQLVFANEDDYLLLWDGANAGEFFKSKIGFVSSTMAKMSLKRKENIIFTGYLLSFNEKYLRGMTRGMGIPHVNSEILKNILCNIPSHQEQQKIASFLDKKTAEFDNIIEKKQSLITKLTEAKKSLISEVVTGKKEVIFDNGHFTIRDRADDEMKDSGVEWLGKIPKEWGHRKLKGICYMKGRIGWQGLKQSEFIEEGPYLITGMNFKNGLINWDECYHITEERYNEAPEIQLKLNDILMTKDGTIGKLLYVDKLPEKASLNSHLLVMRSFNNEFIQKYLYYQLDSSLFRNHVELTKTGTTFFGITQESVGKYKMLLPDLKEQQLIVDFLDEKTAKIDSTIEKINLQIEKLKEAKQSLISEAVTGKIEVLD